VQPARAQESGQFEANALQVVDAKGNVRMILATSDETNQPIIIMCDGAGKKRVIMSVSEDGEPQFSLWDKSEKVRAAAAVLKEGNASLQFLDKTEKIIWSKP
jgi:hypothetical protein